MIVTSETMVLVKNKIPWTRVLFGEDSVIYLCFGSSSMEMAPKEQLLNGVLVFRPKSPRLDSIGMNWSKSLLLLRNWIKEKWKR